MLPCLFQVDEVLIVDILRKTTAQAALFLAGLIGYQPIRRQKFVALTPSWFGDAFTEEYESAGFCV